MYNPIILSLGNSTQIWAKRNLFVQGIPNSFIFTSINPWLVDTWEDSHKDTFLDY